MSYRTQIIFWIDLETPEGEHINEIVDGMKRKRRFSKSVQEGLRLVHDLNKERTGVLNELYPWTASTMRGVPSDREDGQAHMDWRDAVLLRLAQTLNMEVSDETIEHCQ